MVTSYIKTDEFFFLIDFLTGREQQIEPSELSSPKLGDEESLSVVSGEEVVFPLDSDTSL